MQLALVMKIIFFNDHAHKSDQEICYVQIWIINVYFITGFVFHTVLSKMNFNKIKFIFTFDNSIAIYLRNQVSFSNKQTNKKTDQTAIDHIAKTNAH